MLQRFQSRNAVFLIASYLHAFLKASIENKQLIGFVLHFLYIVSHR